MRIATASHNETRNHQFINLMHDRFEPGTPALSEQCASDCEHFALGYFCLPESEMRIATASHNETRNHQFINLMHALPRPNPHKNPQ